LYRNFRNLKNKFIYLHFCIFFQRYYSDIFICIYICIILKYSIIFLKTKKEHYKKNEIYTFLLIFFTKVYKTEKKNKIKNLQNENLKYNKQSRFKTEICKKKVFVIANDFLSKNIIEVKISNCTKQESVISIFFEYKKKIT
jgi:hypothetical protein